MDSDTSEERSLTRCLPGLVGSSESGDSVHSLDGHAGMQLEDESAADPFHNGPVGADQEDQKQAD